MAKKPKVKCPKCGEYFYREDNEFVCTGRRYYHRECFDNLDEEDKLIQQIHKKVKEHLGDTYSKQKVTKQINGYIAEGKTLKGILDAVIYWFEHNQGDPSKSAGGIGIVGYIYADAEKFWQRKENVANAHKNIDLSCYEQIEVYNIKPTPIKKPKRVKLFDLD